MKVALITGGFPDQDNNLKGVFTKKAAKEISKLTDLTVIHYRMFKIGRRFLEKEEIDGYKVLRISMILIPFFNKYTICLNSYIVQFFLKPHIKNFDVVHSVSGTTGISVARLNYKQKFKHICQIIGDDINYLLPQLKELGCVKNLNGINRIVCNSQSLKTKVESVFKDAPDKWVIYRGADLKNFGQLEKKINESVTFLFLGGLANYKHSPFKDNLKGGLTLMEAWKKVDNQIKNSDSIKLLYGGPNTVNNEKIERWKNDLKNKDKVEIIGVVNPRDILKIYAQTNVTIIPSLTEGFPNVGMESFAAGNCVVGSRVGGLPELIDHEQNGFLFEPGNSDELSRLLTKFIDEINIGEMAKNAKNKAVEKFDNSNFGIEYVKVYKS